MSIPPPEERPEERPMTLIEAMLWAIGAVVALGTLLKLLQRVRPSLMQDSGAFSLCQVIAYLVLLLILQAIYFPRTRASIIFGTQAGKWYYYLIALGLGLAIHFPADAIYDASLARWPDTSAAEEIFRGFPQLPLWRKIAAGAGLIVTTPLIEEAFFRGALFGTLRRTHGPIVVVVGTAALFALVHIQPQTFLPIGIVGASLAFLRVASGSMWPGVLMHAVFNAVTFYAMATTTGASDQNESMPKSWVIGGTVVSAGLLALCDHLRPREPDSPDTEEEDS